MSIESRKEVMKELLKEREELQRQLFETEAQLRGYAKFAGTKTPTVPAPSHLKEATATGITMNARYVLNK